MIASLPMYDRPECQAANDALWSGVAAALARTGLEAPAALTREGELWDHWQSPELVLSQTCGLPYRSRLRGVVRIIGSPDYGLEGCPPGYYNSAIVVRAGDEAIAPEDWRGKVLAFNEGRSQSGWAAALNHAAGLGTGYGGMVETGAHINSARAVSEGRADIAVIDAHTLRFIQRFDDWAQGLKVIGRTEPTPATPFITKGTADDETVALLRAALEEAVAGQSDAIRAITGLRAVVTVPEADYLAVPTPAA
ncbi:phosphate/phosphite/phosphonate ABC transporter substrate-binding protein [Pseudooceanicola sp. C21-150M6]|uniref:phosphate/phosphite/phosphonate ABC transporter substrate-binding protein n=1 Tax=Pseudooceanicola sp. C21-150M6 TaxID=3434355 RepID=UPI003D7F2122